MSVRQFSTCTCIPRSSSQYCEMRACLQNVFSRATRSATSRVLIRGVDRFGNFFARTSVAAELGTPTVSPSGPVLVLSDFGRGYAALDFTSDTLGTFEVSVAQFGVHVDGSPFTVAVQEELIPDATRTRTWGSAIDGVTACMMMTHFWHYQPYSNSLVLFWFGHCLSVLLSCG